jgi:hypothetical protein
LEKDPYKLLALLRTRTKFSPTNWFSFDLSQTSNGWYEGEVEVEYAECCMVLWGEKYGDIVPWAHGEAHRWDIAAFPRARLVLEAQSLLMAFLKKTVETILEGVTDKGEVVSK